MGKCDASLGGKAGDARRSIRFFSTFVLLFVAVFLDRVPPPESAESTMLLRINAYALSLVAVTSITILSYGRRTQADEALPKAVPPEPVEAIQRDGAADAEVEIESEVEVDVDDYELMKMFVDALDQVQRNYVEPISRRELMEAAIEGVLTKLDKYSDYIAPEDVDAFQSDVEAEFGGIGIQVEMRDDQLTVVSPLRGSPGEAAGLKPDDVILEVDGQSMAGVRLSDAIAKMKGRLGTPVTIKIRHNDGTTETVEVTRDNIEVETVLAQSLEGDGSWDWIIDDQYKIGYIRISSFSGHTPKELRAALEELKSAGVRGLVLDLRFNPGGLLPAAIEVVDLFVPEGRIVSTSGRNTDGRKWDAKKEGTFDGFPMVVLVNKYSASASEVVSASLQDNERAVVIGTRTWGKGSVQKVIDLPGRSAMKLTTSSYLRPSGKNIHRADDATDADEWGVTPNEGMTIELQDGELRRLLEAHRNSFRLPGGNQPMLPVYIDPQLSKAISHLKAQLK